MKNPRQLLKVLKKILPLAGIYRVGDISHMSGARYPVFQSCRPNCFYPTATGQNTGSQGKGPERDQAIVSCLMETLESYCQEPRVPHFVRASYDFLKDHRLTFDPKKFVSPPDEKARVTDSEPLIWTQALHVGTQQEILVPAELVYFPFLPRTYRTNSHFYCSSNGVSAGSTYLEAVIHGLYEVIERHYAHLFLEGSLKVEAIFEEELQHAGIEEVNSCFRGEFEIQIYALEIPGIQNLPMILSVVVADDQHFIGYGCSSTVEISIERAISEALQSQATSISGSREDLAEEQHVDSLGEMPDKIFQKTPQPDRRTLRVQYYQKRVVNKKFRNLHDEYQFVLRWLKHHGFDDILIANLTRVGIDVPIVKVLVPKMWPEVSLRNELNATEDSLMAYTFLNIGTEYA